MFIRMAHYGGVGTKNEIILLLFAVYSSKGYIPLSYEMVEPVLINDVSYVPLRITYLYKM